MSTYKFDRLPPPTIEFLRVVHGVQEARVFCKICGAFKVVPWEQLGLPDTIPFPPQGSIGECGACGADNVTAEPVWPAEQEDKPEVVSETPVKAEPTPNSESEFSSYLRHRLQSITAVLGPSKANR